MSASEFVFLALGLGLGVAAGAALIEILRARPPAPREVKVTVAQDAIPRRRAATLADDAFSTVPVEPARGGPADHQPEDVRAPLVQQPRRTPVHPAPRPAPDEPTPVPGVIMQPTFRLSGPTDSASSGGLVGVPVDSGSDPMLTALRASAAASAVAALRARAPTAVATAGDDPPGAFADELARRSGSGAGGSGAGGSGAGGSGAGGASEGVDKATPTAKTAGAAKGAGSTKAANDAAAEAGAAAGAAGPGAVETSEPCADARRLADERCELATRARAQAEAAAERLRAAQRAYDEHDSLAERAAQTADGRAVRRAKDDAQARFRAGRAAAGTTEEVEAAARSWLLEINDINAAAREAAAVATQEREAARAIGAGLERTSLEADAARIAAEGAEAACLAAREGLAACEEQASDAERRQAPVPVPAGLPEDSGGPPDEDMPLSAAYGRGGTPRIFRMLRGDRAATQQVVVALAGDDAAERRRWQSGLADLVDAVLADAIEASALEFPTDHPFWGPFTLAQNRDITAALSSLGYRFDGRGGWVDGRVPSQRDLSLALGYAGLDPMRMRHWPTESDMKSLFADVTVAADEHLAGAAGDLTLGELVSMLGRRADGLADVWNNWGKLRPLLLEES